MPERRKTMPEEMITAMTTGFSSVKDSVVSIASAALPIALGIFALAFAVRKGMSFFRSVSN
jgi:hypothetical protein